MVPIFFKQTPPPVAWPGSKITLPAFTPAAVLPPLTTSQQTQYQQGAEESVSVLLEDSFPKQTKTTSALTYSDLSVAMNPSLLSTTRNNNNPAEGALTFESTNNHHNTSIPLRTSSTGINLLPNTAVGNSQPISVIGTTGGATTTIAHPILVQEGGTTSGTTTGSSSTGTCSIAGDHISTLVSSLVQPGVVSSASQQQAPLHQQEVGNLPSALSLAHSVVQNAFTGSSRSNPMVGTLGDLGTSTSYVLMRPSSQSLLSGGTENQQLDNPLSLIAALIHNSSNSSFFQ